MQKYETERLWSKDFFLIWQGQLVSTFGDAAYTIALGFWVLEVTGSTALMGTLMAVSALPGVLISPFAGVWIDRLDKKPLLIIMDILRGISMILLAYAAYKNFIAVWMVFAAGILLSICGAFFRPGINSSIPNMVPKSRLTNANSLLSIVSSGANMLGSVIGGFLYQLLGIPLLFLLNGLSYFFSGGSLWFIKLSSTKNKTNQNFWADMHDGFRYIGKKKGLQYLLIIIAVVNFFFYLSIILFLAMFQKTSYLGAGRYGITMACFMGGSMIGFLIFSFFRISSHRRLLVFIISNCMSDICFIIAVNQRLFEIMLPLIFIGGFFNALINIIQLTSVQTSILPNMRGKVLAIVSMTTQSLSPIAMALGGVIASFIPIKLVISISFSIPIIIVILFSFSHYFQEFVNDCTVNE